MQWEQLSDFSWWISLTATTVTNTINVLLFHKSSAYSNGLCGYSGFSPFACCSFLYYLWFTKTALPAAAVTTFPWHWQWQKYIWLQDHPNLSLCPLPSHIRPGHPCNSKKLVSLTVLRNFELHLNRYRIYFITNTKWDSGGDGKIAFEKGRFFCKETEENLLRKLRTLYCTKKADRAFGDNISCLPQIKHPLLKKRFLC